ncbi:MAG: pyridoxal phosphate-dependent aminotransferase [Firmicutes bacterium]|jgi:aspartate/methionine/tyrosine aminotransferase|nr:pyridoxal phosphate-dependent aminotransferase [Bacillota bacterium]HQD40187.1 pyridoxal phosphate-dependent aminotransferase [Bacillota bacterium]
MRLAQRVNRLGTETAFEVLATVKQLEAEGRSIISFAIGEPDFDTPQNIKDAGCRAIQNNETHYGPSAGIMPLREAIAKYISETRNISVKPEHVVVTPGAKPIIFHGILACVDPGDEVIYPNPGFPIYESMINFVGAKPVPLPLVEEKNFSFDVQQLRSLVTEKTKMIIINSPQNPTGGVLSKEDLEAVAELAIEHDLWVISDEIYSRLVFDGEFRSITAIPGMQERTIIIDGFSKTYAMTGWRLGYGVMNEKLAETVARLETNSESCTATFTQWAGIEALTGPQDRAEAMAAEFRRRRDLIVEGLNQIEGITCCKPGGAFYVYPNVTGACKRLGLADSREFQRYLLYEAGVAVLARTCFGKRNQGEDQEYVRLSYATSTEQIQEGLARIKKAVER